MWTPERVFVEHGALEYPETRRILDRLESCPVESVDGPEEVGRAVRASADPVAAGKRTLFLARQRGRFVKACPCTPGYVRCGYFIINLDLNCPLDCTYCVLQHYLGRPAVTHHVNLEDMWRELDRFPASAASGIMRFGTGELGDSLALDSLTGVSRQLIGYFRNRPNLFLELKTKTVEVEEVLACPPARNVVVSWSLNAEALARDEERGAPPVEARIRAAGRVAAGGFLVGFHFDPLVEHPGWDDSYKNVVRALALAVPRDRVAWISLGSLRFHPALKPVVRKRFPQSRLLDGEFVKGQDGKARYFRPVRQTLYRTILEAFREVWGEDLPVYLCMENEDVWENVLGKKEGERKREKASFPLRVVRRNQACLWDTAQRP